MWTVTRAAARPLWLACAAMAITVLTPRPVAAQAVDLRTWSAESYPAVSGFGAGVWSVSDTNDSVLQSVNGQPTLFHSDFNIFNKDVTGRLVVNSGSDDDYVGFAVGYRPGDITNAAADYLLVDWKRSTQSFNFGSPSDTPGSTAYRGLAVSRVRGIPTADEFWGHTNFDTHTGGGLEELARGITLGDTGWERDADYSFRFVFSPSRLQVYVNGTLELNVAGSFADGRLAFYNFSQSGVEYSSFLVQPIDFLLALRIAGGLQGATATNYAQLNKATSGASQNVIDMEDVLVLIRIAGGLNP